MNTGLTAEHWVNIKRTLAQGWPVCGGFRWPHDAKWVNSVLQMCPSNNVYDGHSVLLVGYRDDEAQPGGGVFLFRNSSGDGRDGAMPYVYARAYMNDATWIDYEPRPQTTASASNPYIDPLGSWSRRHPGGRAASPATSSPSGTMPTST